MSTAYSQVADLDRLVHEPARLAILTALAACRETDFTFLQSITGVTVGNLSSHLTKLEQAGFVVIEKRTRGRFPLTVISITRTGDEAISKHWKRLDELRRSAKAVRGKAERQAAD